MSTAKRTAVVLCALVLVAEAAGGIAHAGTREFREGDVSFKVTCNFLKSGLFDPIVAPDQPTGSHRHDFFGNKDLGPGTDTFAELQAAGTGRTTCNDALDLSGYWVPSLYDGEGDQHRPQRMAAYYRRQQKDGAIQPFPNGLAVITGWRQGDTEPPPTVEWQCTGQPTTPEPPDERCPEGSFVQVSIAFPDCWDGANVDSPNHRDHMAFSAPDGDGPFNVCPESHPVQVPELTLYLNYPTLTHGEVSLSSGSPMTFHADFLNGWSSSRLAERIDTCLNRLQKCQSGG